MTKGPPTSGGEHTFTTRKWGGKVGKNNNNCYAYAVNDFQRYRGTKCKPDYYKVMLFIASCKKNNYMCHGDFHFYKQHSKAEYKVKAGDTHESIARFFKVPVGRVKRAAITLKPGRVVVFKAEFFSHKRGWATGPLVVGAKGKLIRDPRKISRDYPGLKYDKYCSSFCVKNKGIKVGHTHPKVRK